LTNYDHVTGTDLSDKVLARAQQRWPQVVYVAGDFTKLDLGRDIFDVIVTLEVLSHVADQMAFVTKLAGHLRPSGYLMLATQNRYVLERFNRIPPPHPGQLRRSVDRRELYELLAPSFTVEKIFSVSPLANRGIMRLVNSYKLNKVIQALVGNGIEKMKEDFGLGWTLMALARKPVSEAAQTIAELSRVIPRVAAPETAGATSGRRLAGQCRALPY
jgi:SAM-dependent methyltransferase